MRINRRVLFSLAFLPLMAGCSTTTDDVSVLTEYDSISHLGSQSAELSVIHSADDIATVEYSSRDVPSWAAMPENIAGDVIGTGLIGGVSVSAREIALVDDTKILVLSFVNETRNKIVFSNDLVALDIYTETGDEIEQLKNDELLESYHLTSRVISDYGDTLEPDESREFKPGEAFSEAVLLPADATGQLTIQLSMRDLGTESSNEFLFSEMQIFIS